MKIIRPLTVTDAILTSSSVAETDYTAYSGATTYALGDRVRVVSTDVHDVYESLQASNTNHTPASSPTWWVLVGRTNRWKAFDNSVTSQTSNTTSINNVFTVTGRVDAVALMNISCASIQVTVTDATDGLVYDETVSGIADSGITDWYMYFFEPIIRISDITLTDLPPYANSVINVIMTDTGNTVLLGACVLGQKFVFNELGVEHGATVGIQDYSVKQRDAYGNYTILERAFNKRANFTVFVPYNLVDIIQRTLAQYRATPIVYIGSDDYSSTIIYGFYKDFTQEIAYATKSICSIELEGLT